MEKRIKFLEIIIFTAAIMLNATGCSDDDGGQIKDAIPDIPSKVVATAVSSNSIVISWNAVPGALQYYVYGSSNNGNFTFIGLTPQDNLYDTTYSYTASSYSTGNGLYPARTYYFKVSALNHLGESPQSPSVSARTMLPSTATQITDANIWADGYITAATVEQWFKFTATASNQFIHFYPGTLNNVLVRLYDSNGEDVGSQSNLSGNTLYTSRTVTAGSEYYIKVTPSSGSIGSYKIAFNTTSTIPPIDLPAYAASLTSGTWSYGSINASGSEQWFKFTAVASTHYIHFRPGTTDTALNALNNVYVRVYDSAGVEVGTTSNLSGTTTYTSRTVTSGNDYYIRVTSYNSGDSGTYRITFSTNTTAPAM